MRSGVMGQQISFGLAYPIYQAALHAKFGYGAGDVGVAGVYDRPWMRPLSYIF